MTLVNNIQNLCETHGTTLIGLERVLGFGRGTIRKWDNSSPSVDKVSAIAKYFNVSIDDLLTTEDKLDIAYNVIENVQRIAEDALDFPNKKFEGSIFSILSNYDNETFTEEEQKEISNYIDFVLSKRKK